MSNSALTAVLAVVTVVSLVALVVAAVPFREVMLRRRRAARSTLPTDVAGLRSEVELLRSEEEGALRHLALVRYDAFGDMGGRLSWSLALADDRGDGVVLTSISGRSDARSYAKNISGWAADQPLSPEEEEAVAQAKAAG